MTEHEWLACTDPEPMLEFLKGNATDRKLRLFACACCRHTAQFQDDQWKRLVEHASTWLSRAYEWLASKSRPTWWRSGMEAEWAKKETDLARRAVELAERVADGFTDVAELKSLYPSPGDDEMVGCYADGPDAAWAAKASAYRARWCAQHTTVRSYSAWAGFRSPSERDYQREQSAQCHLLRDLFGNPFRPVPFDPASLTAEVVQLAQAIYDERAFDRVPILAGVLERAGCTNVDMLTHADQHGEHVRGCWLVDVVLGKE